MRMRHKKHGAERIAACAELLISEPEKIKENISGIFPNDFPIKLEIGCGKGDFACGMSEKYPKVNFIAMEVVTDVICAALEKAKSVSDKRVNDNLRFINGNARDLAEYFPEHSLDGIYLNFSDPWPKKGHAKRRLTYRSFLEIYRKLLKPDGHLIFKTDNVGLFDFSLEEFEACGLEVLWSTRDLHNSERAADNVLTEYERNFSAKGFTINYAEVRFPQ